MFPEQLQNVVLNFLVWDISKKERGYIQYQLKEPLFASVITSTTWGQNKVAFWMNQSF